MVQICLLLFGVGICNVDYVNKTKGAVGNRRLLLSVMV